MSAIERGLAAQALGTWSGVNGTLDPGGVLIHLCFGPERVHPGKGGGLGGTRSRSKVRLALSQRPLSHRNDAEYVCVPSAGIHET